MSSNGSSAGHRRDQFSRVGVIVATAAGGLGVSYIVAVRDQVSSWELSLTEWISDAPDIVAGSLYPIMQLGTLGGPLAVAAGIALFKRDWWLSGATVVVGLANWFGAKGVKRLVDRGRPGQYLSEIVVREGSGTGLGFISGHSAVAAGAAVMAMVAIPRPWRPVAAVLAGLVGLGRIVHGVHFPADVVGGWSFGVLVAIGALAILEVVESRPATVRPTRIIE